MLAGYWLAIFAGTHVPPEFPGLPPAGYDKIAHFTAYFLLAGMMIIAWRYYRGRVTAWTVLAVAMLVACYAAIDEITQPWFRRDCDINDWFADMRGALLGIFAALAVLTILSVARRPKALADQ
jgi:VanZ family protein